jgi:hypothetical protein
VPLPDTSNTAGRDKNTLFTGFIARPGLVIGGIVKPSLRRLPPLSDRPRSSAGSFFC